MCDLQTSVESVPFWNLSKQARVEVRQVFLDFFLDVCRLHAIPHVFQVPGPSIHSTHCCMHHSRYGLSTSPPPTNKNSNLVEAIMNGYRDPIDLFLASSHPENEIIPCRCPSRDSPPPPAPIPSLSISRVASRPVACQEPTLLFPRRPAFHSLVSSSGGSSSALALGTLAGGGTSWNSGRALISSRQALASPVLLSAVKANDDEMGRKQCQPGRATRANRANLMPNSPALPSLSHAGPGALWWLTLGTVASNPLTVSASPWSLDVCSHALTS